MVGTPADAKSVSEFGVVAMSAMVGMFADKASDKLAEILIRFSGVQINERENLEHRLSINLIPRTQRRIHRWQP
jgi:hypothetical protein